MDEYVLKVKNVSKAFGGVQALDNVSFELKAGEVHCLAGENGSGKSTIIKIISGFYTADSGMIEICGKEYRHLTPKEAIKCGVQIIYQDMSVFPNLTVMENLAINSELLENRKILSYSRMRKNAIDAMNRLSVHFDLDEYVGNLSVGEKHLIAICRALMFNTKLIIMDEPTASLNKKEIKTLFENIRKLQSSGVTILFVSHKLEEVFEISENFTIFRNGKTVASGSTRELDSSKFAYYMTGRTFEEEKYSYISSYDQQPRMEIRNLGLKGVFSDITFKLYPGEILGVTGLLGSGREELMLSIFGLYPPCSGQIFVDGKEAHIKSTADAIKNGIGYVPSDRISEGLFLNHSVELNTIVTKLNYISNSLGLIDKKQADIITRDWINSLSISAPNKDVNVQTLSGGNQQKVILARWLSMDLSVIILNGPTVGVDIGAKYDIYHILKEFAKKGISIILVSDDIPEIMQSCNRVMIINGGKIICEVNTDDISSDDLSNMISQFKSNADDEKTA